MTHPIRVLIADDHRLNREGLQQMLQQTPSIRVVGSIQSIAELEAALRRTRANVILLDLKWRHSETAGFRVLQRLRSAQLPVKVILMTAHPALLDGRRYYTDLADGILVDGFAPGALVAAIQAAVGPRDATTTQSLEWRRFVQALSLLLVAVSVTMLFIGWLLTWLGGLAATQVVIYGTLVFCTVAVIGLFVLRRLSINDFRRMLSDLVDRMTRQR